jgi:hypothetical protein
MILKVLILESLDMILDELINGFFSIINNNNCMSLIYFIEDLTLN